MQHSKGKANSNSKYCAYMLNIGTVLLNLDYFNIDDLKKGKIDV